MSHPKEDPDAGVSSAWSSKKHIIIEHKQMGRHLLNAIYFAWANSDVEWPLYGLYTFVFFLVSLVTEYDFPYSTMTVIPQAAFQASQTANASAHPDTSKKTALASAGTPPGQVATSGPNEHEGDVRGTSQQHVAPSGAIGGKSARLDVPSDLDDQGDVIVAESARLDDACPGAPDNLSGGLDAPSEHGGNSTITDDANQVEGSQATNTEKKAQPEDETIKRVTRIPDISRMFVLSNPSDHLRSKTAASSGERSTASPAICEVVVKDGNIIVDLVEIKRFPDTERTLWLTPEGRDAALALLSSHDYIDQIHDAATTAVRGNTSWTTISAILIVGCYFSHFVWTNPKTINPKPVTAAQGPGLPPTASPFGPTIHDLELARSDISGDNTQVLMGILRMRIEALRQRVLPQVFHFCQPAFVLSGAPGDTQTETCDLSVEFIATLTSPLRGLDKEKLVVQPSWLDCPTDAFPLISDREGTDMMESVLRDQELKLTRQLQDILGGSKDDEEVNPKKLRGSDKEDAEAYKPSGPQPSTNLDAKAEPRATRRVRTKAVPRAGTPKLVSVELAERERQKAAQKAAEEAAAREEAALQEQTEDEAAVDSSEGIDLSGGIRTQTGSGSGGGSGQGNLQE